MQFNKAETNGNSGSFPPWRTLLDNFRSILLKSSFPLAFTDDKAVVQELCYDTVLHWKSVQVPGAVAHQNLHKPATHQT